MFAALIPARVRHCLILVGKETLPPGGAQDPNVLIGVHFCGRQRDLGEGCQIFLGTTYQNGGKMTTKYVHKKCAKWS
jgi:hypothetical protein